MAFFYLRHRFTLIYATLFLFQKKKTCAKRKTNFFGKAFFLKERFVLICVYILFSVFLFLTSVFIFKRQLRKEFFHPYPKSIYINPA